MKFIPTELDGAMLVEMEPHRDERGYFARTMCVEEFGQAGLVTGFPQASQSHNLRAGTVRGMHFQDPPHAETKRVRCVRGASTWMCRFHSVSCSRSACRWSRP